MAAVTLAEIVGRLGGTLRGDGTVSVARIATLEQAGPGEISFLANPRYQGQLSVTNASAVILAPDMADRCPVPCIVTPQPYLYFARLAQWLNPPVRPDVGADPRATVLGELEEGVSVGAGATVAKGGRVGRNTVVGPGCVIGEGAEVGPDSWLHANVTVYPGCRVGARAILHSGVVIGADGFGFAREADGRWLKIPQTGRVVIGDDVEIGANTTIDRGAIEDTVIEDGVKLDNQIQVGHNVRIGAHSALAGCTGIAGSTHIGRRCTIGGASIIIGHLDIADNVHISAGTMVTKSIPKAGSYTGSVPFMSHAEWLKNFSRLRHLDAMADKIRALETEVARLAAQLEKKSS